LEKNLAWYKFEYDSLMEIKKKNETSLTMIKADVQDLKQEAAHIRNQVKAEQRLLKLQAV